MLGVYYPTFTLAGAVLVWRDTGMDVTLVLVQLETTGFDPTRDQVLIIAAEREGATFCRRIIPSVSIKPEAAERNGLSVRDGCLYYGHDLLFSNIVSRRKAWSDFIEFVSTCSGAPLLVGHHLHERFVRHELQLCDMKEQFTRTLGVRLRFADSTMVFKQADPDSDGELCEAARRHLDHVHDTWDLFPIPMYRLELMRGVLHALGVTTDVIERVAVPAC